MSIIQKEFVRRTLEEEGHNINDVQTQAINKYLKFRTGRLLRGRKYDIKGSGEMDGKLTITHPVHQRFLDIKPKNVSVNMQGFRKRSRKAFPIHNRIVFGHLNRIAFNLMYGLTEEVRESIKNDLDNQTI